MKKYFLCAVAALCLVACNQNAPTDTKRENAQLLDGITFCCVDTCDDYYLECYLYFGKPYESMMFEAERPIWRTEHKGGIFMADIEWHYILDETLIKLEKNDPFDYNTRYATYHNDSIYYGIRVYHRVN